MESAAACEGELSRPEGTRTIAVRWIPGFESIAALPRSAIPREIGAGISVAAVAIPIGLAYAKLTGVPNEIGLYASIVPTAAYALFGPSSRYLIVGPDTATWFGL